MASQELTGGTPQDIAEMSVEYKKSRKYQTTGTPFETAYCLTRVGKQPDDYDGVDRYCKNRASRGDEGEHYPSCNFHGGNNGGDRTDYLKHLSPIHAIKHGMYATDEHLEEVFTDDDRALYDYVMSWADTYGWPSKEEDPSRYDDLHAIAMAKVRNARANKYILDEGELKRQEVYDENGNLLEKDDAHALSEDVRLKRKLILSIKKELGITPKARSRMDTDEKEASAMEQISEVAAEAVLGDAGDEGPGFDPDDAVFEDDA